MADHITVRSAEGRPVDPEVPGNTADMDAAVASLLAAHDDRRTDGPPPWPPTWAMYGRMWEERDKATREVDRLRAENDALAAALDDIAGGECWQTRCPDGDLCDVCTARKARGRLS